MKINNLFTVLYVLLISITFTSCVEDDEYTVPSSLYDEENEAVANLISNATQVSFADVKAMYNNDPNDDGNNNDALPFLVENDIYIKGYVTSSDQTGNFYKELFIQDSIENPSSGLKIILNQVDTYNQFNKGREVYVNLKGLQIGEERTGNNVYTIGGGIETDQYGSTVTSLGVNQIKTHLFRSPDSYDLVPLELKFSEITDQHIGLYVIVGDAEFEDDLNGLRYFDPMEDFDTQRTMQACSGFEYITFPLETSSFATFKEELLPTGNGTIKAVVSKTYDASSLILALNTTEDVQMEDQRCSLAVSLFQETFDDATDNTILDTAGWLNIAQAGSVLWTEQIYGGNGYAEFSPYGSGEDSNIAWLIAPAFDFDTNEGEVLTFQTEHAYPDVGHEPLQVLISTDFDGNPANITAANWEALDFEVSYIVDFGTWYNFTTSGEIDLSSYTGTAHIAFVYTGSDTADQNMTLHIDNIGIYGI